MFSSVTFHRDGIFWMRRGASLALRTPRWECPVPVSGHPLNGDPQPQWSTLPHLSLVATAQMLPQPLSPCAWSESGGQQAPSLLHRGDYCSSQSADLCVRGCLSPAVVAASCQPHRPPNRVWLRCRVFKETGHLPLPTSKDSLEGQGLSDNHSLGAAHLHSHPALSQLLATVRADPDDGQQAAGEGGRVRV